MGDMSIANYASERKWPFMKLYTADYRDGTAELSFEEAGFYMACLTHLHDGEALPADPQVLSRKLRCNARTVRKIVPKLIECGKLIERNGFLYNARVLRDLGLALPADAGANSARTESQFAPSSKPIESQFEPNSTPIRAECSEKPNKINVEKTPITRYQIPETRFPPNPPRGLPQFSSDCGMVSSVDLVDDKIVLADRTKEFWLGQFGGSQADLDLALIEARGCIQPNSRSHNLQTQVERKLAHMVRDRKDRDKRYAAACKARETAPAPATSDHRQPDWAAERDRVRAANRKAFAKYGVEVAR